MKRSLLLAFAPLFVAGDLVAQQTSPVIVLRRANLADGARGQIATNSALVIRDGQIAQIEAERVTPPAGATVRRRHLSSFQAQPPRVARFHV